MATDWRETWRKRLVPAAAAMKHIKAGNRVFIGSSGDLTSRKPIPAVDAPISSWLRGNRVRRPG